MFFSKHFLSLRILNNYLKPSNFKLMNYGTMLKLYKKKNLMNLILPFQYINKKYFCHSFKDDSDSDNEDFEHKRNIKAIILPNNDDLLINKIYESNSIQDVFDLIHSNNDCIDWKSISMALAMIREFQIIYFRVCMLDKNLNTSKSTYTENFENILSNFEFLNLLQLLEENYEYMNEQCLSYCLLCLHKLGVNSQFQVNQKLSLRLKHMLMSANIDDLNSNILSRFTVAIVSRRDLTSLYMLKDVWPLILKKLDSCSCYNDLKHISICMYNLPWFLNKDIMNNYENKLNKIVLNELNDDGKIKCIIKSLKLLNSPYWLNQNISLIRNLLLNLCGSIKHISLYDLIQLQMVILKQLEPYELFEEINQVTSNWLLKANTDADITLHQLLSCIVPSSSIIPKKKIEELLRKQFLIEKNGFSQISIGPLFNIIRNLKTSDHKIYNTYWSSILNWLYTSKPSFRENQKLLRICNRYMNFNNNMAGTFRHYKFENQMIKWLYDELNHGLSIHIPSKFSKIFSFIISYPNENIGYEISEKYVENILKNIDQYSIYDCYIMSRGLHNALLNRKKKTSKFLDQYIRLGKALNKQSKVLLTQNSLNINQVNVMFRGYNHRYNIGDPELFYKIIDKYKSFTLSDYSSRSVRELIHNLSIADWYDGELMNSCADYCLRNHNYLLAENVEKLLTHFFIQGVSSDKFSEFLPHASGIINRDKHKMSGLNFMRASLALCYFYSLPSTITDYLFSVEFLERLDEELNHCYAKHI
ncbi:uncharacterized protein LOC126899510 isoform X2 [Daktulosphaira vitifoliae]|uniref:uncharacterized protein LOC126899510 isoform X2 n=1 Tax=Daktulosphaira vitifoliae TaxID=58002 RepID=UPI0021A99B41|nr:uncharacterized protein LOC126899510 isoform X2 [Daktulosphaira vitifoliae]